MNKTTVIILLAILALIWIGNATSPAASSKAAQLYQTQVAKNFEEQYNQVVAHGTPVDRCVRAGLVAEGYLQAGDNDNFAKWVDIKSKDCKAAGLPQ